MLGSIYSMFESISGIFLNAVLTGLTISLGAYAVIKYIVPRMIEDAISDVKEQLFDFLNSEEGQKTIYGIGGLIGNGAKTGLGLQKTSGKMGLTDLAGQIIGGFLQGKMQMPQQEGQPQQATDKLKFKY